MNVEWYTPADLAALNLPEVPATVRGVNATATREGWQSEKNTLGQPLARKRKGRGGGWEYHFSLLPHRAQLKLVADERRRERAATEPTRKVQKADVDRDQMWGWYDALPSKIKAKAEERLRILDAVRDLRRGGMLKNLAVELVAEKEGVSSSTVWNWLNLCAGKDRADWLPYLAPRHVGRTKTVECHADAWEALKADYLRLSKPPFESCYRRVKAIADANGWGMPSQRTLERRMATEIPKAVMILLREGEDALRDMYPAQERDRTSLHAMEAVNIDGHKWDVFVRWPDGTISRPLMVAIQDLYSNKCLAWRVDKSENSDLVRLALADVFRDYGLFDRIYMDNGRAFASKYITGGTPNRYRFKVKPEDPTGILTNLDIEVTWTRPYSGQSKPIERMFRDFCDNIAKHPVFEGAYTGNKPDAKPENYGTKAVPLDEFLAVVEDGIRLHNARPNRRTRVCQGSKSFDDVFNASYAISPIRKATEEQVRMCLLAAQNVRTDIRSGAIKLLENRYWSDCLHDHINQAVTVRFDPDRLHDGVHVYRLDGGFIGHAACIDAVGFSDTSAARDHAAKRKRYIKATKEAAELERGMTLDQLVALQPDIEEAPTPEAKIVRPFITAGNTALKREAATEADAHTYEDFSADFSAGLRLVEMARAEKP